VIKQGDEFHLKKNFKMEHLLFLIPFLCIISTLVLFVYLRTLSKLIAFGRNPNVNVSDTPNVSIHFAPIPFIGEPSDDNSVKALIRKRNWLVLFFWMAFIFFFASIFYLEKLEKELWIKSHRQIETPNEPY
jgi:hypothetical protein